MYLKQQEHTLENILLMLGKVCIQNSSNGNIKLAPQAKIITHRLNFSLKLRCSPHSWEKRGHIPSSIHSPTAILDLEQWRAALGLLYIMPAFLPLYSTCAQQNSNQLLLSNSPGKQSLALAQCLPRTVFLMEIPNHLLSPAFNLLDPTKRLKAVREE